MKFIKVDVFNCKIYLAKSLEEYNSFIVKYDRSAVVGSDECSGITADVVDDKGRFFVVMALHENSRSNTQVIVHESVHAAIKIMDSCGVPISEDNQETIAYLTDYIFSKAVKFYQ